MIGPNWVIQLPPPHSHPFLLLFGLPIPNTLHKHTHTTNTISNATGCVCTSAKGFMHLPEAPTKEQSVAVAFRLKPPLPPLSRVGLYELLESTSGVKAPIAHGHYATRLTSLLSLSPFSIKNWYHREHDWLYLLILLPPFSLSELVRTLSSRPSTPTPPFEGEPDAPLVKTAVPGPKSKEIQAAMDKLQVLYIYI